VHAQGLPGPAAWTRDGRLAVAQLWVAVEVIAPALARLNAPTTTTGTCGRCSIAWAQPQPPSEEWDGRLARRRSRSVITDVLQDAE